MSDSLRPHEPQHARSPCPSTTPRVYPNSCPLSQWCHPTISSSVISFSSCLQSFPASGFFPMSQFFASGSQSIGASASASVPPMDIQDWFPIGLTGFISLQRFLSSDFCLLNDWMNWSGHFERAGWSDIGECCLCSNTLAQFDSANIFCTWVWEDKN